jgi:hypothetical protein
MTVVTVFRRRQLWIYIFQVLPLRRAAAEAVTGRRQSSVSLPAWVGCCLG